LAPEKIIDIDILSPEDIIDIDILLPGKLSF
jgi:hypothetical protein